MVQKSKERRLKEAAAKEAARKEENKSIPTALMGQRTTATTTTNTDLFPLRPTYEEMLRAYPAGPPPINAWRTFVASTVDQLATGNDEFRCFKDDYAVDKAKAKAMGIKVKRQANDLGRETKRLKVENESLKDQLNEVKRQVGEEKARVQQLEQTVQEIVNAMRGEEESDK